MISHSKTVTVLTIMPVESVGLTASVRCVSTVIVAGVTIAV